MKISCTLIVDGAVVPGDRYHYATGDVVALDDLSVQWGRSSRLEQPRPASLSARIALPDYPAPVLEHFAPGRRVECIADLGGFADGEFEHVEIINDTRPRAKNIENDREDFQFAPAAFQPTGQNPAAWNDLPRVNSDGTYSASVEISLPPGAKAVLYPMYYSGPWINAGTLGAPIARIDQSGSLKGTFRADPRFYGTAWVGLFVIVEPTGTPWKSAVGTWRNHSERWARFQEITITRARLEAQIVPLHRATVFTGRITDAPISFDEKMRRPVLTLTAMDFLAELANQRIGDKPFPRDYANTRARRIIDLSGRNIQMIMDPTLINETMAPKDIDSRTPAQELGTVAASTGAIMWPASHTATGDYLRFEDPAQRKALYSLTVTDSGDLTIDAAAGSVMDIPAATIHRDVRIERDLTDLATVVGVQWIDVTYLSDGTIDTTQRTAAASDEKRISEYGYRQISISTDLDSESSARTLARRTLDAAAAGGWLIPSARIDSRLPGVNLNQIIRLLDSTTRIGAPIMITGAAPWIPGAPNIPAYIDGGSFRFTGGRWVLECQLTRASTRARSVTWADLPARVTWTSAKSPTWADLSAAHIERTRT